MTASIRLHLENIQFLAQITRFRVSHLRPLGQLSVYLKCNPCSGRMQEKHARTIWNCEFRTRAKPCAVDIFSGRNGRSFQKFRVLHLRPLGQLSVSIFIRVFFQKIAQKFVGEKTGEKAKNIRFWDFPCWDASTEIRGTKFTDPAEISSQSRYNHFDTAAYLTFVWQKYIIPDCSSNCKAFLEKFLQFYLHIININRAFNYINILTKVSGGCMIWTMKQVGVASVRRCG